MSKTIKRIAGLTVVIATLSTLQYSKYLGLNIEANASSEYGISSLELNKGGSTSNIQLYSDSNYKKSVKFNEDVKTYYAKTNMNSINLDFDTEKGYEIKAFKSDKDTATSYDSGDRMVLGSGTTVIYVRTYEKGDYDCEDSRSKVVKEYQIYVTRDDGYEEDNEQDKVYLKDITLSVGDLDFNKKITTYDVAVETSEREITVKAKPEEDGDTVSVNGSTLDYSNDYKKTVNVRLGMNTIEIKVKDDDNRQRTYKVNILRGDGVLETSVANSEESEENSTVDKNATESDKQTNDGINLIENTFTNKWVQENGKWKYYDITGNYLKDTWFTDKNTGKEYYLYSDGAMAIGWIAYNNQWYYLGQDGSKQTGWQFLGGKWYYLNGDGSMKIGWFKDSDGKWYYFYSTGAMAQNTTIDGYLINVDGSCWS